MTDVPTDLLDRFNNIFTQFNNGSTDSELVPILERDLQSEAAKIFEEHGLRGFESRRSEAIRHQIGCVVIGYHDGRTDIKQIEISGDVIDGVEMWYGRAEWKTPTTFMHSDPDATLKRICAMFAGTVAEYAISNPEGKHSPGSSLDERVLTNVLIGNLYAPELSGYKLQEILHAFGCRCREIFKPNKTVIIELLEELEEADKIGTKRLKHILSKIEHVPELLEPGLGIKKHLPPKTGNGAAGPTSPTSINKTTSATPFQESS
jgi:hypothetical protein